MLLQVNFPDVFTTEMSTPYADLLFVNGIGSPPDTSLSSPLSTQAVKPTAEREIHIEMVKAKSN